MKKQQKKIQVNLVVGNGSYAIFTKLSLKRKRNIKK